MEPAFHIGRNFTAPHPSILVVQKKYRTIEYGIDGIPACPFLTSVKAGAVVDAGGARVQIAEQRKLEIEPSPGGIRY
jgi:hypothetical protein